MTNCFGESATSTFVRQRSVNSRRLAWNRSVSEFRKNISSYGITSPGRCKSDSVNMAMSSFSSGTVVLPKNHLPSCSTASTEPPPTRMPKPLAVRDAVALSASCNNGSPAETRKPTATPPSVISSGMMKCSKSMKVAAISPANTMLQVVASKTPGVFCDPKTDQQARKARPVRISTPM